MPNEHPRLLVALIAGGAGPPLHLPPLPVCAEVAVLGLPGSEAAASAGRRLRSELTGTPGGAHKLAFAAALRSGFELVAVIDGGQQALAGLPALLAPLLAGEAEAVLGAGASAYAAAALRRIRWRGDSEGPLFDAQVEVQLRGAGARVIRQPGAARAGGFAGLRLRAAFACHRLGILQQRRFDPVAAGERDNSHYSLKLGYPSSHTFALEAVPPGARVMDIGAGPGGMAQLLADKGCTVAVVDRQAPQQADPRVQVFVQDLDSAPTFPVRGFRYLLLLDVIEHLRDPELFLEQLRAQFGKEPQTLILTTPNVGFAVQRLMLLLGQFNYGMAGILDRTHTRLFTFGSLRRLLRDAGFRTRRVRGVPAPFPKVLGDGMAGRLLVAVNQLLIKLLPRVFSYQIFVEADCVPGIDYRLAEAEAAGSAGPIAAAGPAAGSFPSAESASAGVAAAAVQSAPMTKK